MQRLSLRSVAGDVLLCVGFFTRIPASGPPGRRLADAIWAAPLAGVLVGAAGAAAYGLTAAFGLPPAICGAAALGATMLVTGCLHEDGLADVADGFGGGNTRQRKLEIMKDSRIGTFGVVALVLTILARWTTLGEAPGVGAALLWLVAAHAASRAAIPLFMILVPPARSTGLSAGAGSVSAAVAFAAAALGALALLLLGPLAGLVSALLLAAWLAALKTLAERQIGGQTGDVLGALQQGGELAVLVAAVAAAAR